MFPVFISLLRTATNVCLTPGKGTFPNLALSPAVEHSDSAVRCAVRCRPRSQGAEGEWSSCSGGEECPLSLLAQSLAGLWFVTKERTPGFSGPPQATGEVGALLPSWGTVVASACGYLPTEGHRRHQARPRPAPGTGSHRGSVVWVEPTWCHLTTPLVLSSVYPSEAWVLRPTKPTTTHLHTSSPECPGTSHYRATLQHLQEPQCPAGLLALPRPRRETARSTFQALPLSTSPHRGTDANYGVQAAQRWSEPSSLWPWPPQAGSMGQSLGLYAAGDRAGHRSHSVLSVFYALGSLDTELR
jgi:hypothetical protein